MFGLALAVSGVTTPLNTPAEWRDYTSIMAGFGGLCALCLLSA